MISVQRPESGLGDLLKMAQIANIGGNLYGDYKQRQFQRATANRNPEDMLALKYITQEQYDAIQKNKDAIQQAQAAGQQGADLATIDPRARAMQEAAMRNEDRGNKLNPAAEAKSMLTGLNFSPQATGPQEQPTIEKMTPEEYQLFMARAQGGTSRGDKNIVNTAIKETGAPVPAKGFQPDVAGMMGVYQRAREQVMRDQAYNNKMKEVGGPQSEYGTMKVDQYQPSVGFTEQLAETIQRAKRQRVPADQIYEMANRQIDQYNQPLDPKYKIDKSMLAGIIPAGTGGKSMEHITSTFINPETQKPESVIIKASKTWGTPQIKAALAQEWRKMHPGVKMSKEQIASITYASQSPDQMGGDVGRDIKVLLAQLESEQRATFPNQMVVNDLKRQIVEKQKGYQPPMARDANPFAFVYGDGMKLPGDIEKESKSSPNVKKVLGD
jgi:hypothetical protein